MLQLLLSINGLITGIASLSLGLFVISKNWKNIINRTLFLLLFVTAFWSFGYWQWLLETSNYDAALFWCRVLTFFSTMIPVFFYHWIISILVLNKSHYRFTYIAYFLTAIFVCFSFSPLMVRTVEPFGNIFTFWPKAGTFYTIQLFALYFGLTTYVCYLLIKHYRLTDNLLKTQIKYILLAVLFGFIGGATNYPLWYNIPMLPIGEFIVIFYPITFTYTIVMHRLLNIKMVLRKSIVIFLSFATIIGFVALTRYIVSYFLDTIPVWIDFCFLIISILCYTPIKTYYFRLANYYFFASLYDSSLVISDLINKLRSTLDINQIYEHIHNSINKAMHLKAFGILNYDNITKTYNPSYTRGFFIGERKNFFYTVPTFNMFFDQNQSIVIDEIRKTDYRGETKELIDVLVELKVSVLAPLNIKGQIIGLLALGEKESGDMFNDEDLELLEIVGSQAALSIANAQLYTSSLQANVSLKEEENKIAAIINNLLDPIIFIDKNNRLSLVNQSAKNIFGFDKYDIGKIVETTNNFSMNNFKSLTDTKFGVKTQSDASQGKTNEEEVIVQFENQELVYKVTTVKVSLTESESLGVMKIFYNLTKERELDRLKSEFISIAAHQLRTPLAAIKWIFELVLSGDAGNLTPDQRNYLNKGHESNERIINLVNDLLNVSRIEEGRFVYNFQNQDLGQILDIVMENFQGEITKNEVVLTYNKPERLPLIWADKEKISMVLQNIIENAIKYTATHGKIDIEVLRSANFITIIVEDNGIGIPDTEIKKLFTKFFRASNVTRLETKGTGLGLFIVKNIIEKHKGKIGIDSHEGKGTKVTISLPVSSIQDPLS